MKNRKRLACTLIRRPWDKKGNRLTTTAERRHTRVQKAFHGHSSRRRSPKDSVEPPDEGTQSLRA